MKDLLHGTKRLLQRGGLRVFGGGVNWYVDSVAGDDSNDGKTASTPFRTLAAVQAVALAGHAINLKRGATWLEQLTLTVDRVTVQAYGTGDRPVIDARDPISAGAWSKTAGRTNVYETTVTFDTSLPVGTTVRPFEDDVLMVLVADVATCDSTPGSYYIGSHTVSPQTLYIHTPDSDNPAASGQTYTYTKRSTCIDAQNQINITIKSIYTIGSLSQYGTMVVSKYGTYDDCYLIEGEAHNSRVGSGSALTNCYIKNGMSRGGSASLIVWNETTPNGEGIVCSGCTFETDYPITSTAWDNLQAIYSHYNTSGSFGAATFTNCTFIGLKTTGDINDCTTATFTSCTWTNCKYGVGIASRGQNTTINGGTWTSNKANQRFITSTFGGYTVTLNNVTINLAAGTDDGLIRCSPATMGVILNTCTFSNASAGFNKICVGIVTAATVTIDHCVFQNGGAGNWDYEVYVPAPAAGLTLTSDYNSFQPNKRFNWLGSIKSTLADWQSASGQDANST